MLFLIKDNKRKENCIEFIHAIPVIPLSSVEIKEYKKNRTLAQNRTFHGWCDVIAKETGNNLEYIKDSLKLKVLGIEKRIVDGVELTEIRSTARLDVSEFRKLLEATQVLALSLDIKLMIPDDYAYAIGAA